MKKREQINLLVIDQSGVTNYYKMFQGKKLSDGTKIKVEQCGWENIDLYVESEKDGGRAICNLSPSSSPIFGTPQKENRTFIPDFLLVRNTCHRLKEDYRNVLYGFYMANVPSVNSLMSLVAIHERPVMYGELNKLKKKYGKDKFPLIDQMYFMNDKILKKPTYDNFVLKVGYAHAGYGKIKVKKEHKNLKDIESILQMYGDYYTAEPFIDYEEDIRIQKIGDHLRAFSRKSVTGNWKANVGLADIKDVKVNDKLKFFINESSKLFGGLDLCALDVLRKKDKYYILELNDSAIGLNRYHEKEDNMRIVDLVVKKMDKHFIKQKKK